MAVLALLAAGAFWVGREWAPDVQEAAPPNPPSEPTVMDPTFYQALKQREAGPPLMEPPPPPMSNLEPSPVEPASKEPAPPVAAEPQKKSPKGYTVQAAAFRQKKTAELLIERLQKKGYPAYLMLHTVPSGEVWYRVRVGRFSKRSEAEQIAKSLKEREKLPVYVARDEASRSSR
jgi:cell division septation protein DedD